MSPPAASPSPSERAEARARRDAATVIAREAAAILLSFKDHPDVSMKGVGDLVTAADRASEAHVLTRLAALFPDDAIVGEEGGGVDRPGARWVWYVDPLDGTTNYVHGLPHYCVAIGACLDDQPAVGVVFAPEVGRRLWSAALGDGATVARGDEAARPIHVSATRELAHALLATGFPYDRSRTADQLVVAVARGLALGLDVRRLGSAALDLAYVAQGTFPAYWEPRLKPWDFVAGAALVREAGGRVTDLQGGESFLASGDVLASNGLLHDVILRDVLAP